MDGMVSRTISGAIALAYLVAAYFGSGGEATFRVAIFLVFPLACIWYSESMGEYVGGFGSHVITERTPGCFVAAGGWLLLFLPIIALVVIWSTQ
jgi:hypothetical protein